MDGYYNIKPKIKRLDFDKRGKMQVELVDGRIIIVPLSAFPSIKKIPLKERKNYHLMGGGFTWDCCNEVIHIEQVLGCFDYYSHES